MTTTYAAAVESRDAIPAFDPYRSDIDPDRFDPAAYLAQHDERLLLCPAGRRTITRLDPLLFALVYFRHHLRSDETGNKITFSQFHFDLCRLARRWIRSDLGPAEVRDAWIAPRGSGKSTWVFGILPAWALAHGHRRFVAAFADSGHQAQQHLSSLKREFDTNALLATDYPGLCRPAVRAAGTKVSDNQALYVARDGAAFLARGIDSSTLGAKVGNQRPDMLLFDDVEPDESNYSDYQKEKRLGTIVNAVFPMNTSAVVVIAGTTTMPGSITHDLVRQITDTGDEVPTWPRDENIATRYYPALETAEDGAERSLWPARWPLDYLRSIRHTRSFALNMQNQPRGRDGGYWAEDDFTYGSLGDAATRWILQVDPAVTTKDRSDWTGLAVVGYALPRKDPAETMPAWMQRPAARGMCEVAMAKQVKLVGDGLRREVLRILNQFPRVKAVRVEVNQGGELWLTILHHLPAGVKLLVHTSTASKEVRFAEALDYYQRGQVVHRDPIPVLEEQQMAFPKAAHDDVADAAAAGVLYFLGRQTKVKAGGTTSSYV